MARTRHCECLLGAFKATAGPLFIILALPATYIIPPAHKQSCPVPKRLCTRTRFFCTQNLLTLENSIATHVHDGEAVTSEQTKKWHLLLEKKKKPKQLNTRQTAFGGGTIWVPIDELPIISYWKFLFSSVYKLCQNLTVLAEITHARCLPQADFCWIASSKMSQLFPRTKLWKNTLFCPC